MNLTRKIGKSLVALSLTGVAAFGFAGPAHAGGYDGQDPNASGCGSDAITAASVPLTNGGNSTYGSLELRYSPYCRTVWARVWSHYGGEMAGIVHRDSDGAQQSCGPNQAQWSSSAGEYYCYTPMLNDANVTSYAFGYAAWQQWQASVTGVTSHY
jgi:hypothetical protein